MRYKNVPGMGFEPAHSGLSANHGANWLLGQIMRGYKHCFYWLVFNNNLENRWLRSRHISVHVCMTPMIIADYDRLKLSTPECLLFRSAKQYLLGIKMYLKTTQK